MKNSLIALLLLPLFSYAQPPGERELDAIILHRDSLFWEAYNQCDTRQMAGFFTGDLEFYHDKGGITLGNQSLAEGFQKNVCAQRDGSLLRREAVPGTLRVFPMRHSGVIYGAILSGEHLFYVQRKGEREQADGLAKFTHLWILDSGEWKMKRVLSYDHQPAPYTDRQPVLPMTERQLKVFAGTYKGPQTEQMLVRAGNGFLDIQVGEQHFKVYPETSSVFFMKERPIRFEFIREGRAASLIVKEQNIPVEELRRSSTK